MVIMKKLLFAFIIVIAVILLAASNLKNLNKDDILEKYDISE